MACHHPRSVSPHFWKAHSEERIEKGKQIVKWEKKRKKKDKKKEEEGGEGERSILCSYLPPSTEYIHTLYNVCTSYV